ncbi:MAG TPA: substrate-binding domain-containing protein [Bacteroidota bacterium]|nr:substrate-binding domain-containing protein [Bacteroidota bacterium]
MTAPRLLLCALIAACAAVPACSRRGDLPQHRTIAGLVYQEDQFFRFVLLGMHDAAARRGAELLEANSDGKPDREIQLINTYAARGVDAIVISPLSARASSAALTRAREKGITVVTYNTTVEGDIPRAYVESDQEDLGRETGRAAREYIERRLGGRARVALLEFQSQAPEQNMMRVSGFKNEVTRLPGVVIVAEQDAWLAEQAVRRAGDILTAHPDLDILWGANEGATVGSVMAVRNAGRGKRVAVFGTDTGEQITEFLLSDDGILQAVTGQQPFEIGSRAVGAALDALDGKPVQSRQSLPGILLTRSDPPGVRAFALRLKELTR